MIEEFRELARRMSELERRMANVIQTGTVSDVDYDTGRYRVHLATGDKGEAVKTPWIRSSELAGWANDEDVEGVSSWTPLVKGQQGFWVSWSLTPLPQKGSWHEVGNFHFAGTTELAEFSDESINGARWPIDHYPALGTWCTIARAGAVYPFRE